MTTLKFKLKTQKAVNLKAKISPSLPFSSISLVLSFVSVSFFPFFLQAFTIILPNASFIVQGESKKSVIVTRAPFCKILNNF